MDGELEFIQQKGNDGFLPLLQLPFIIPRKLGCFQLGLVSILSAM
jgi:hypothetical protein